MNDWVTAAPKGIIIKKKFDALHQGTGLQLR